MQDHNGIKPPDPKAIHGTADGRAPGSDAPITADSENGFGKHAWPNGEQPRNADDTRRQPGRFEREFAFGRPEGTVAIGRRVAR